eukprot:653725-Pyramimonas_sp.AAC.2
MRWWRARVRATLTRGGLALKCCEPSSQQQESTITSFSAPWKASTVETCTHRLFPPVRDDWSVVRIYLRFVRVIGPP